MRIFSLCARQHQSNINFLHVELHAISTTNFIMSTENDPPAAPADDAPIATSEDISMASTATPAAQGLPVKDLVMTDVPLEQAHVWPSLFHLVNLRPPTDLCQPTSPPYQLRLQPRMRRARFPQPGRALPAGLRMGKTVALERPLSIPILVLPCQPRFLPMAILSGNI